MMPGTSSSLLSGDKYGYDMVVAVTEQALDRSMRFFLMLAPPREVTLCYCYDENGVGVPADYNAVIGGAGFDPYSIPSGTYHCDDQVGKLDTAGFCFAMKIKTGSCDALNSLDMKVIQFNQGMGRLKYSFACPEVYLLTLTELQGGKILKWTNLSQRAGDAPWIFSCVVNIGLRSDDTAFSKLPADTQNLIKNLNPDSAFSIQQLYMDLSTVSLESPPTLDLDPDSEAAKLFQKIFVNAYFAGLPPGSEVLGYAVQPVNPFPSQAAATSTIPTAVAMEISPYVNSNGDANPQQQALYTLNYLVMTDNKTMPVVNPFNWNWVESGGQGVMAVNRNIFAGGINHTLSNWLSQICIQPQVQLTLSGLEPNYHYHAITDNAVHTFVLNPNDKTILSFKYSSQSSDASGLNGCLGSLYVGYNVASEVVCQSSQIIITTTAIAFMSISKSSATASGNALHYQAVLTYHLSVDESGKVSVSAPQTAITDCSDNISPDGPWGAIVNAFSGGEFQELINNIKGSLQSDAFNINHFDQDITRSLQDISMWVFPGQYDFLFTDVFFSDGQDLITPIAYRYPIPGQ